MRFTRFRNGLFQKLWGDALLIWAIGGHSILMVQFWQLGVLFCGPDITRKYHKTLSCNFLFFGETCWRCSSKPDPPDLLQSSRWCPAITRLEACSRSTSHYMDPSDPPGHGNTGDWCSGAGRGQIVLATNRKGRMLRLIAPRHDDDDDDDSN